MRLVSYGAGGRISYGVARSGGVVDVGARLGSATPTLRALLEQDRLAEAREMGHKVPPDYELDMIDYLPTITNPGKIVCIGSSYARHDAGADGRDAPAYPSVFLRTPESVVGHEQLIMRPPESAELDYEGEIALVIGRPGRRIAREAALAHVAGLTLMNEGSVRDWQRHAPANVTPGKNFERSGSLGPWLVTRDEFSSFARLDLSTHVNGALRQSDTTSNLLFTFDYLISYVSTFMSLNAGDVIATGTPAGTGWQLEPPAFLADGDIVEISVPEIGTLRNRVVDEQRGYSRDEPSGSDEG